MIKIEDIQEGSLWFEVRGEKFLWRLRFYNPNVKSDDKVSTILNSNSSQAKTKARQLLLKKAKAKIDEEVKILDPNLSIKSFCFEEVANVWLMIVKQSLNLLHLYSEKESLNYSVKNLVNRQCQTSLFFNFRAILIN